MSFSGAILATTVAKLGLRAMDHSDLADSLEDAVSAIPTGGLVGRLRGDPFERYISADFEALRRGEFERIEDNDWDAACMEVADLLQSHDQDLAVVVDPPALMNALSDPAERRRRSLGSEAAQCAFDRLLPHAVNKVAQFVKDSPGFQTNATAEILRNADFLTSAAEETFSDQKRIAENVEALLAGATFGLDPFATFVSRQETRDPGLRSGAYVGHEELVGRATAWAMSDEVNGLLVVSGPGGRGKTRLCVEALLRVATTRPELRIWVLSPTSALTGQMLRQLQGPCIVFIDDAHLRLSDVAKLIGRVIDNPQMRLLLSTRPQTEAQIMRGVSAESGGAIQLEMLRVPRLTETQAHRVVDALLLGSPYKAPPSFRAWLIHETTKEPYLPVHAVDLFRSGKLDTPLAVHEELRRRVLGRHLDEHLPSIEGITKPQVKRLVAGLHALGKATAEQDAVSAAFGLAGIPTHLQPELMTELEASGVIERAQKQLDVVPEILGDYCLEAQSNPDPADAVAELWAQLARFDTWGVLVRLCALDWRLNQQNRPGAIDAVWSTLTSHFASASWAEISSTLPQLEVLCQLQAARFGQALLELIGRAEGQAASREARLSDAEGVRGLFHEPGPLAAASDAVKFLCKCATTETALTASTLDAAWRIATAPGTDPSNSKPAIAALEESFATITPYPNSYERLRAMAAWTKTTAMSADTEQLQHLASIVKKGMSKTYTHTEMASRDSIAWRTVLVHPSEARPMRDDLREAACIAVGKADRERATSILVSLVESTRRVLAASDVQDPEAARRYEESWESDDLDTLAVVSECLPQVSPAVRRLTRRDLARTVQWPCTSMVGWKALEIVTNLDERREDDWAQVILDGDGVRFDNRLRHRRGIPLPKIENFDAERNLGDLYLLDYDTLRAIEEQRLQSAAAKLLKLEADVATRHLYGAAADVMAATGEDSIPLYSLWAAVAQAATTDQASALTQGVAAHPNRGLDDGMAPLVGRWLDGDPGSFYQWYESHLANQRTTVRREIASALTRINPTDDRGQSILSRLLRDQDQAVRDRAVASLANQMLLSPEDALARLLRAKASVWAIHYALSSVQSDIDSWVSNLSNDARESALQIIESAGMGAPNTESVAIALLKYDSDRVIAACAAHYKPYHGDFSRLMSSIGAYQDQLLRLAFAPDPHTASPFLGATVKLPLPADVRGRFVQRFLEAGDKQRAAALCALSGLGSWPVFDPDLAMAVLDATQQDGVALRDGLASVVRQAMLPTVWSVDSEGKSPELNPVLERAKALVANPAYRALHEGLQLTIDTIIGPKGRSSER